MTTAAEPVEHVLVVPTELFHELGHFQGFTDDMDRYLETLLDPIHASYRPRDAMEKDPSFKQLIPYCLFVCDGAVFHYQRGSDQGESRLHAKRSIGVGGHVSTLDLDGEQPPYFEGMKREIAEEVFVDSDWTQDCVGLINDDETDVGRVHLGVVHVFKLDKPKVDPCEKSMINTGFSNPAELVRDLGSFETWSQICLKHLFS